MGTGSISKYHLALLNGAYLEVWFILDTTVFSEIHLLKLKRMEKENFEKKITTLYLL